MDWLMNINFWARCMQRAHSCRIWRASAKPISSTCRASSASSRRRADCLCSGEIRGARLFRKFAHELQMAASPIRLSVVHPGGVSTNIVRNSRAGTGVTDNERRAQLIERFDAAAKTTPAAAALRIIQGIEKNQPRILIGNDARFMDLLQRFRPATYWAVLARRIEKMAKAGK